MAAKVRALPVDSRVAQILPDTDPASIRAALPAARRVQFAEPLPAHLLSALADAMREFPEIGLRVFNLGVDLDPDLGFLQGFTHVRHLSVDLLQVESFEPLRAFGNLTSLSVGQTRSRRPSLDIVRDMPGLRQLYVEGHDRGFEAVAGLRHLQMLSLVASRVQSLACLAGHPELQRVWISFGGIRDLSPLARLPKLRDLSLHRSRLLNDDDLLPLAEAEQLDAVELQDLRNLTSLAVFGKTPAIRFLHLEGMQGLGSLEPLGAWPRLQQLEVIAPGQLQDRRLGPLLRCQALQLAAVSVVVPAAEVEHFHQQFAGQTFWYRGQQLKGHYTGAFGFWDKVDALRGSPLGS